MKGAYGGVSAGMVVADVALDLELLRGEETEIADEQPFGKQEPWVYLVAGYGFLIGSTRSSATSPT